MTCGFVRTSAASAEAELARKSIEINLQLERRQRLETLLARRRLIAAYFPFILVKELGLIPVEAANR